MKLICYVASAVLFIATQSIASDLSVANCLEITAGLNALDHYDDPGTGKPKQYRLGALRGRIGLNMAALRHVTEAIDKARIGLIAEVGGGKSPQAFDASELSKLNDEYRKLLDSPCDVNPGHIKMGDLHLGDGPDDNAIPPSVIGALAPILD